MKNQNTKKTLWLILNEESEHQKDLVADLVITGALRWEAIQKLTKVNQK